ncbi:MAG: hypothetical protein FWH33_05235 [Oscillospiraceae bacterium]|nr:hypothetical protein [Oscillospiraceae bacterium]
MGIAKVKTLIIALLVLVNAFFLTVILVDDFAAARTERQAIDNVCTILRSNGIMIEPDSIKKSSDIRAMRASRDTEQEAAAANALIGPVEMTDQGVIYLYNNPERGSAKFSIAGDFEFILNEGCIPSGESILRTVNGLLRDMKFEAASLDVRRESSAEIVTVVGAYKGASIFNLTMDFMFSESCLREVRGRYLTGIEPVESGSGISNVSTALLGFLAAVKRGDVACSAVYSVEAGYQYSVVGSFGDRVIMPSWLVVTDMGRYIIDCESGDIRMI